MYWANVLQCRMSPLTALPTTPKYWISTFENLQKIFKIFLFREPVELKKITFLRGISAKNYKNDRKKKNWQWGHICLPPVGIGLKVGRLLLATKYVFYLIGHLYPPNVNPEKCWWWLEKKTFLCNMSMIMSRHHSKLKS